MTAAAMRAMFRRLRFSADGSRELVVDQQIDTMEELKVLEDDDCENLCKIIRRPGGGSNGHQVSNAAESNLKLAAYYLRHRARMSRTVTIAGITLALVRSMRTIKVGEEAYEEPTESPKVDHKDWPKTMEGIRSWLFMHRGVDGAPLSYCIRADAIVIDEADDPEGTYTTVLEQIVSRCPIYVGNNDANGHTPNYIQDNTKVWDLMFSIFNQDEAWVYIKAFRRTRNGRGAYEALWNHYLGPNNVENMANTAESKLESLTYYGEKRRFNFEKYTRIHKEQHEILAGLTEYGYAGIDERSKVRHLNKGIKTNALDVPKGQIIATPRL